MNRNILEIRDLSKWFGGVSAVRELSFDVEEGAITGLIGPNGAGKTTVMDVVSGIQAPSDGSVFFRNEDVTNVSAHKRVQMGLARTFQHTELYEDATVLESINRFAMVAGGPSIISDILHTQKARSFLDNAEERSREIAHFVGLERVLDEPSESLPYGSQRALGVAMALALGPRLIMLDEPVAGMNVSETADMARLIRKMNGDGMSVLVIEHDMSFVMNLCDRVVAIAEGQRIGEGTPVEVQADDAVIAAYLGEDADE